MRLLPFITLAILGLVALARPNAAARPDPYRSPCDLAVLPGGRVLTANRSADSVSLVDLRAGRVLAEVHCGHKPSALAVMRDGRHAAVSNLWSGTVTFLDVQGDALKTTKEIAVGPMPRGLAFAVDGTALFVAVAGADEIARIDVPSGKVTKRWPAPREPHHVALSPDGRWLAVASTRSGQIHLWDTGTGRLAWEHAIVDGFNLRGLAFAPDGATLVCSHGFHREFPVSKGHIEEGWVIDSRLSRFAVPAAARPSSWQVALDQRGKAVGDPDGLAFAGDSLAVCAAGTHELLLFDADHMPWREGSPGDFLDVQLEIGAHRMRRVELGGRPLAVAPIDHGNEVVIANALLDAVQIVDVKAEKLTKTVHLGGPSEPSLERQGEALFYDARRSHNQWFSCNTCHSDGHTCGLNFDTLNDDSYGNPKLTPSLRGVTKTGPWTWHGWQKDLGAGVAKSFTETMFGPKPTHQEIKAVLAYLTTLDHPPSPHPKDEAARRGEKLFHGKAACAHCHKGPEYTSEGTYDVGLEDDSSPYAKWNPPSLRGLWDRGPYLHDGRAQSLGELLEEHHTPQKLGGEALSPGERKDLIAFLKTL